jgi:eukaryotic-like serine/threonine-protein kinase
MEALEGRSLGAVIREEGPLPVGRTLALVENVARALAAAHARGVIHRDVKPENVFVVRGHDGIERAKVLDFGISHVDLGQQRITRAGSIIGTPEYMAPEQALGGEVDHRADVYALGVLAFEMLTGTLPLVGDSAVATLLAHQTRVPAAPSQLRAGVPAEVDALVLRALAKNPAERFDSMLEVAAEVARIRLTGPLPPTTARSGGFAQTVRFDPDEAAGLRASATPGTPALYGPGGMVALPDGHGLRGSIPAVDVHLTDPGRRPLRRRWAALALAGLAAVLVLGTAAWWRTRSAGPEAVAPRVDTSSPPVQPPAVPGAIDARPAGDGPAPPAAAPISAPVAAPVPERPAPGRAERTSAAARGPAARPPRLHPAAPKEEDAPQVKDPYAEEAGLKPDPFR